MDVININNSDYTNQYGKYDITPTKKKEINALNLEYYSKIALPLFAFYMMIFGNLMDSLIGKNMLKFIKKYVIVKHLIAIITLLLFVILANQESLEEDILNIIVYTISIYILVIITFLLHPIIICIIVLFLFLIYIFSVFIKKREEEDGNDSTTKQLKDIKHIMSMMSLLLILVGFAIHVYNNYQFRS
jgi:hypothetical protein